MAEKRFIVVGSGKMAADILSIIAEQGRASTVLGVGDSRREVIQSSLEDACASQDVPYVPARRINDPEVVAQIAATRPDFIVSANNFQIFGPSLIGLPGCRIINFHNGPLPRYGGLHACSWAIINGEREHGITWHFVDEGIDSGPIIAQTRFPVEPDERAMALIGRCITQGVDKFRTVLGDVVHGSVRPQAQQHERRLYYGRKDLPWAGVLPWWEPVGVVDRLARGIDFHPYPNVFVKPRIAVEDSSPIFLAGLTVDRGDAGRPGEILSADGELTIGVAGGRVVAEAVFDTGGRELQADELRARGYQVGRQLQRLQG